MTITFSLFCSFEKGGIPAKFVIIDDGWQSVSMDPNGTEWKADNAAKWVLFSKFHDQIVVSCMFGNLVDFYIRSRSDCERSYIAFLRDKVILKSLNVKSNILFIRMNYQIVVHVCFSPLTQSARH